MDREPKVASAQRIGGSTERFQPRFIVGPPSNPSLGSAFEKAITILKLAPNTLEVFKETEVDRLVDKIKDERKRALNVQIRGEASHATPFVETPLPRRPIQNCNTLEN